MGNLDIAYLARGTITNPKEINTTKDTSKALEKQKKRKVLLNRSACTMSNKLGIKANRCYEEN